jgi:hypothetical protein
MTTDTPQLETVIAIPGDWIRLEPETFANELAVEDLVGDRLNDVPELAPHREELVGDVTRTLARAVAEEAMLAAVLADVADEEQPMIASLMVLATASPPPDVAAAEIPSEAELAEAVAEGDDDTVADRHVGSVLLPGGPAMRIARVQELNLGESGPALLALTVQYYFMVPGIDQFVVLSFASPTVGAHLRLQEIFHEIAASFRFVSVA